MRLFKTRPRLSEPRPTFRMPIGFAFNRAFSRACNRAFDCAFDCAFNLTSAIALSLALIALVGCGTPSGPREVSASDPETSYPSDTTHPQVFVRSEGHHANIAAITFDSTGKTLYSAGYDKSILVWDVEKNQIRKRMHLPSWKIYDGATYALDVSPNDRWLAAGGCQGCSGAWKADEPFAVHMLSTETGQIVGSGRLASSLHSLQFSPDGDLLATGEFSGALRIWRVEEDGELFEESVLEGHVGLTLEIAWFSDSNRLVTIAQDGLLVLWGRHPLGGWFPEWNLAHNSMPSSVAVSPDGTQILCGLHNGKIEVINPSDGKVESHLPKSTDGFVFALQYANDGKSVVYGSTRRQDGVWEHSTGLGRITFPDHVQTFEKTEQGVYEVAWTGNQKTLIAVSGASPDIRLHHESDLAETRTLPATGEGLAWLQTRGSLIGWKSDADDKLEQAFDLEQMRMVPVEGEAGFASGPPLEGISLFVNDPQDGYITTKGGLTGSIRTAAGTDDRITAWAMYAPNKILVGNHEQLRVVDFAGRRRRTCFGHAGSIWHLSWLREGRLFVSSSSDRTVRVWNASTCELLLSIFTAQSGQWAAWTPDAYVTHSDDGASLLGFLVNQGPYASPKIHSVEDLPERNRRQRLIRTLAAGTARGERNVIEPNPTDDSTTGKEPDAP